MKLTFDDFTPDAPWEPDPVSLSEVKIANQIEGVVIRRLEPKTDKRGSLTVLGTDLNDPAFKTPHVYLVHAAPGSIRAWVYHKRQFDCLAYTNGNIRIVLYDLRPDSPTYEQLNVIDAGTENKIQLTIPPLVVHGVQNRGSEEAFFINMPTRAYDPTDPDKARLRRDDSRIPYAFE